MLFETRLRKIDQKQYECADLTPHQLLTTEIIKAVRIADKSLFDEIARFYSSAVLRDIIVECEDREEAASLALEFVNNRLTPHEVYKILGQAKKG